MSKTQTSHEPSPDELEHAAASDEAHETDGHGHAEEALGPVDVQAWGALLLGVGAGLLIALCLVITTSLLAPASL